MSVLMLEFAIVFVLLQKNQCCWGGEEICYVRDLSCKQYQIFIYKYMLTNHGNRNPTPLFNDLMY